MKTRNWIKPGLTLACAFAGAAAQAAGGYFAMGYGPTARHMAGATTAFAEDAFAGASNPAKWLAAGNRVDIGGEFFMPFARVKRTGSNGYDMASDSDNEFFVLPEGAVSRRLSDRLAFGLTLYGNGGLNTEFRGNNGVRGSNLAPTRCNDKPANFFLGCDKLGLDIQQLVIAPGVAYEVVPGHTLGVAPLLTVQRFEAYGFQAFAPFSQRPTDLTNRGWDWALGIGVRVGWLGELRPGFTLGAAWASRIYMDEFEQYEGLIADGQLDIPENYSIGFAWRVFRDLTWTFDYQRINFGDVPAVGNGVLATLLDPIAHPLGSSTGSGFNWENQDNFRTAFAYDFRPAFTVRFGYAYGAQTQRDTGLNSVTMNMLTPNAEHQVALGFTWRPAVGNEFHMGYNRYIAAPFRGPSATALLGIGGHERIEANVDSVMVGWSWKQ
ncbi:MAG: OmpP1/FadL family transporter [Gammaproteobacteria bacterium]